MAVQNTVTDATDTNIMNLRKAIYLTLMSSATFEEALHKLLKLQRVPGTEPIYVQMIIECCGQEKNYSAFYGLMGERYVGLASLIVFVAFYLT